MSKVKNDDTVKVHYTGKLENGEIFDSSKGNEPLEFKVGNGQMIPGFDHAVNGMELNESKTVTIPSDEAYGPVHLEMIQRISRENLPTELQPEVGQKLQSRMADGHEIVVSVTDVTPKDIEIDANHPLAGKDLVFEIEVVEINA